MQPTFEPGDEGLTYARKSKLDPKNPGKSTEDQESPLVARLEKCGLTVSVREADEGVGASQFSPKKAREGFARIMEAIRTRKRLRAVAFWELSRSARMLEIYAQMIRLCDERGIYVLIKDRWYDPRDPNDRVLLGLNALLDEAEVARLRARTLRGIAGAAERGLPHGRPVYGYRRVYHPHTKQLLAVEVVEEEAAHVREAARRVLAGESGRRIIADLTERTGRDWHHLKDTLLNPAYAGVRVHRGVTTKAIWDPILDEKTVADLTRFYARTKIHGHTTNPKHLLAGILTCAPCDAPMYWQRYVKLDRNRYCCQNCGKGRAAAPLEELVIKYAKSMLLDPDVQREIASRQSAGWDRGPELAALERELADVLAGDYSAAVMDAQEKRLGTKIEALKAERERVTAAVSFTPPKTWPTSEDGVRSLLRRTVRVTIHSVGKGPGFNPTGIIPRLIV